MSPFNRFQKTLSGGEALRPVDDLILMAIVLLIFVKFWA